jgi:hypothetical protein
MLTPRLPSGFHAQPAFHHQDGWLSYDFYRVYTPARELDPLRSFWLMTSHEDARGPQPPKARWISFSAWAHHFHKGELAYAEFANPQTPLATVHAWLDAAESSDLEEVAELK